MQTKKPIISVVSAVSSTGTRVNCGIFFSESQHSAEILTQELRLALMSLILGFGQLVYFIKMLRSSIDIADFVLVSRMDCRLDIFNFGDLIKKESKSWALFGESSYAVTDQLEVGVGLRYFEDDRRSRAGRVGPFQEDTFDSLNPKVLLKYALTMTLISMLMRQRASVVVGLMLQGRAL